MPISPSGPQLFAHRKRSQFLELESTPTPISLDRRRRCGHVRTPASVLFSFFSASIRFLTSSPTSRLNLCLIPGARQHRPVHSWMVHFSEAGECWQASARLSATRPVPPERVSSGNLADSAISLTALSRWDTAKAPIATLRSAMKPTFSRAAPPSTWRQPSRAPGFA